MKKILNSALIVGALTMGIPEKSKAADIVEGNKQKIEKTIENNYLESELYKQINLMDEIIKDIVSFINKRENANIKLENIEQNNNLDLNLTKEELEKFNQIINIKEVQDNVYFEVKDNVDWSNKNLLNTLFALIIYLIPYFLIMREQIKRGMPIKQESFILFGTGALYQALFVAGFIPASSLYMASIICGSTVVLIHQYKKKTGTLNDKDKVDFVITENQTKKIADFKEIFDNFPSQVVKYNLDGYPEIWNKEMAKETGYTHEEVIEYWREHGTVMTLTYTGENLERVKLYLESINQTGVGYQNVSFTMTTKSGEEKTFLWNTMPYEGGTIRVGRLLTNNEEIQKELERTKEETKKDHMTGAYNLRCIEDDFHKLLTSTLRKHDPKKYTICLIDLDDFKNVNDKYSHEVGDMILKKFTSHIMGAIRGTDKLYRIGGDEFILFLDSDLKDQINVHNKLNKLRQSFYEHEFTTEKGILKVGSSWGTKLLDVMEYYDENLKIEDSNKILGVIKNDIDKYMYGVKYYKLIKNKLIKDGRIQENWEEKNAIAEAIYNGANNLLGVLIIGQNGSFSLSIDELKEIDTIKMNIDNLRS